MNRFLLSILSASLVAESAFAQIPLYENHGVLQTGTNLPPQIDALAFANYGTFDVFTAFPFDFQNVVNFTNRGTMLGSPGFIFQTSFTSGKRLPAANFVNASGATITSVDGGLSGLSLNAFLTPSFLNVAATNVSVQGILSAGAGGLLRIEGNNVDVSRGGLEIRRLEASPFLIYETATNFFPDVGIDDIYWATTNANFRPATLLDVSVGGTNVTVPGHIVTNANGGLQRVSFRLTNPLSFVQTNKVTDTNWLVQGVFVGLADASLLAQARFADGPVITNLFKTVVVQLAMPESNVVTGDIAVNTLYISDDLASNTNYTILSNILSAPVGSYRPANYRLTRDPPNDWFLGTAPTHSVRPDLYYDTTLSNAVVTNFFSSYAANLSSLPLQPPQVPGYDVTNLPGRIEIQANDLNLNRTRIRGNALVTIDAKNLLGSTNSVVDSPNLNYLLGAVNHTLMVTNLAKEFVSRFGGQIRLWSAVWTNNSGTVVTNVGPDPNDPSLTATNVSTNVIEIGYHAFVVDATGMQTIAPVQTYDFQLRAADVVVGDALNVTRTFFTTATNFTIAGSLALNDRAEYWRGTNAPNLVNFTNTGNLFVFNAANFVEGRSNAYSSFVNQGTMDLAGMTLRSDYFENAGTILTSDDGITLDVKSGRLEGGLIFSSRDVVYNATDLKFFRQTNVVNGSIVLNATSGIADSGQGSANFWTVGNGFHLLVKPQFGDLLGTSIRTIAPEFTTIEHTWAGEDRGGSDAGFVNNVAIGQLTLDGQFDSVVRFSGAGEHNALYVDYLAITNSVFTAFQNNDLGAGLEIDDNMVIYFASASVPAEQLDGQLGNRLRWVSSFKGPNSAVDVLRRNGRIDQMNRAVRESTIIDSDDDGLPNASDPFPLDPDTPLALTGVAVDTPPSTVSFSWDAKPATVYRVEFTSSLGSGDWRHLTDYTNTTSKVKAAVVQDWLSSGSAQRYYRVQAVGQLK